MDVKTTIKIDVSDIAIWFLSKESITHKKLQKLTYYAVAWGWALMSKSIATNDGFQAWVHGPVSPSLYATYKDHGWNAIPKTEEPTLTQDIRELLESVWATYGDKDGNELEALSHIELPWRNARRGLEEDQRGSSLIDTEDMKNYYLSIYKGDDK